MSEPPSLAERRAQTRRTANPRMYLYGGSAIAALSAVAIVFAILAGRWVGAIGPAFLLLVGALFVRESLIIKAVQRGQR